MVDEPRGGTLVVGIPGVLGHEEAPVRATKPYKCWDHGVEVCVVERH
jgi:hypothetical protein